MKWLTILLLLFVVQSPSEAYPRPKDMKKQALPNLSGTSWFAEKNIVGPTTYTFRSDGILVYSYKGNTHTTGSWSQVGNILKMETNQYAFGEGTILSHELIQFKWHNKANTRWEIDLVPADKK